MCLQQNGVSQSFRYLREGLATNRAQNTHPRKKAPWDSVPDRYGGIGKGKGRSKGALAREEYMIFVPTLSVRQPLSALFALQVESNSQVDEASMSQAFGKGVNLATGVIARLVTATTQLFETCLERPFSRTIASELYCASNSGRNESVFRPL